MAAAVLVSVDGSLGSGGFGISNGGTGTGTTPGPGPGIGNAAWNRSLERALEEAAASGVLNLSGRKLKEFPSRSAANQDLSDTVRADLSRNRLSEVPAEVCQFVSLESLNLYQNCIRYIPEAVLNLQALTFLNVSRNQLSVLPAHVCSLPLKVLIASNNKLVSLPEEIGHLRHLTELDVSCNEIQMLPPQIGSLESLRDLNVRRNQLVRLPEEVVELPLIRLDFSCNKITTIPVCYRNLRHLQTIVLDNNPLQCPPAQICIKGKIHIFKYLNIEACKIAPELPEYERRPIAFGSCHEDLYPGRPYGALDSGFNSVDSGDKRWSGNEPTDEFSDLPLRVAEITKEQRQRRESQYQENHRTSMGMPNGGVEHDLDQIDYIDSCATEEEEEDVRTPKAVESDSLSSQFMAYIERRRVTQEVSPIRPVPVRESSRTDDTRRYPHQIRELEDPRRPESLNLWQERERQPGARSHTDQTERSIAVASYPLAPPNGENQLLSAGGCTDLEMQCRREQMLERTRKEAQFAALQYNEERMRTKQIQREAVLDFVKQKTSQSPQKPNPVDSEFPFPSRRSQHTDDSALLVNGFEPCFVFEIDSNTNTIKRRPGSYKQSDERPPISPTTPTNQSVPLFPPYPGPPAPPSYRSPSQRPESFLFRAAMRDDQRRVSPAGTPSVSAPTRESPDPQMWQTPRQTEEDLELMEQLRKNIETRLKVSLPSDLGAALTDGVVLCHLANHVRPRSVPSIHVPSPAVPKLTMAKCRRNVENFLEACRRIGVSQDSLCSPSEVLQLNPLGIMRTVETLLSCPGGLALGQPGLPPLSVHLIGFLVFYCAVMLTLYALYQWTSFSL
nr:PREDICTED: leucine-rich repeat and calponin homology domain-containing protein 3 isoform X3 [Latimeria chalumnae]|eukprot:XP_014344683.1 PREDICTED: leucine-rich repeat and calponin homology domain-containing protein 3 isoform X3 [Latimeria chalumnae]